MNRRDMVANAFIAPMTVSISAAAMRANPVLAMDSVVVGVEIPENLDPYVDDYGVKSGMIAAPIYRSDIEEFVTGSAKDLFNALAELETLVGSDEMAMYDIRPTGLGNLGIMHGGIYEHFPKKEDGSPHVGWWYVGYYDINKGRIVLYDGENTEDLVAMASNSVVRGPGNEGRIMVSHEGTVAELKRLYGVQD